MNFRFLRSACILIEGGNKRVLTDPWLEDAIYYGSWAHYPAYDWRDDLSSIDYIYLSHVVPSHCDPHTLKRLPKVPVLLAKSNEVMKPALEALGFEVRLLEHGETVDLGGLTINVMASHDYNAEVYQRFYGCSKLIPGECASIAVFQDDKQTYVNAGSANYQLCKSMLPKIRSQYPVIDMLFVAYSGAGPYPQCFILPEYIRQRAGRQKKEAFTKHAAMFAKDLRARETFLFAGDYALCGRMIDMNNHRGMATLSEAYRYFDEQEIPTFKIEIDDMEARSKYLRNVLIKREMDYERSIVPPEKDLIALMREAWGKFESKRKEIGLNTSTTIYLQAGEAMMRIPLNGHGQISQQNKVYDQKYVKMTVDPRLLVRLLCGPQQANWTNAEIGSHIQFERHPADGFERGLHYALSFLHN